MPDAIMITLSKKLRKAAEEKKSGERSLPTTNNGKRASIRDFLLIKEVPEMEANLPLTCKVKFSDPNQLHVFDLIVVPDEGYWKGGKFCFHIFVTEEYNIVPPKVKCMTKLWHPNINEDGDICLSLLRQNSIDGLGWAPTRRLKDVCWGLNSLFTDLLNFEDPLNIEAADHYQNDKSQVGKSKIVLMLRRKPDKTFLCCATTIGKRPSRSKYVIMFNSMRRDEDLQIACT